MSESCDESYDLYNNCKNNIDNYESENNYESDDYSSEDDDNVTFLIKNPTKILYNKKNKKLTTKKEKEDKKRTYINRNEFKTKIKWKTLPSNISNIDSNSFPLLNDPKNIK